VLAPACFDEGVRGLSPFSKFWVGIRKATVPHLIAAVRVFDGADCPWVVTHLAQNRIKPAASTGIVEEEVDDPVHQIIPRVGFARASPSFC
jgi:hypothetical protein